MNIYAAASLFAILILLYWVISEVFTVLFRLIGLPEEKARFQVVSMLTCAGFTTHESELFLSTRSRRRLARLTMLFGYVFNVTIVSALVNVFLSVKALESGSGMLSMLIPIGAGAAAFALTRIRRVRDWVDRRIEKVADRYGSDQASNGVMIIDQFGSMTIARVTLHTVPEAMRGKTLAKMGLKPKRNILVLAVERSDGRTESPSADTGFAFGDRVTVFGDYAAICKVFDAKERFSEY